MAMRWILEHHTLNFPIRLILSKRTTIVSRCFFFVAARITHSEKHIAIQMQGIKSFTISSAEAGANSSKAIDLDF